MGPLFLVAVAVALLLATRSRAGGRRPPDPPPVPPPGRVKLAPQVVSDVERWRTLAEEESRGRVHVWTALLLGLVAKESRGMATAVGATDDYGLCQITKPAWQDYQAENNDPDAIPFPDALLDPRVSLRIGAWFLNRKAEEMGNVRDGLRAYNAGTAGARRNPTQSADYADWILSVGEPAFRRPV